MKRVFTHVLLWAIITLIWSRIVYFYVDDTRNKILFTLFDIILIIIAFYIMYYFVIPKYFFKKHKWSFTITSVITIIVLGSIISIVMHTLLQLSIVQVQFGFSWQYSDLIYNKFFIAIVGCVAGCAIKLALDWVKNKRRIDLIEKNNTITELSYLKAQLNPHFLFNSINSLYVQMDISIDKAKDTLLKFSDMLRYQLYECNVEKIPIEKEIDYLQNYISLQKLRKEENCQVEFICNENVKLFTIAPLLLIQFVENAFKYVAENNRKYCYIRIELIIEKESFLFKVGNTKNELATKANNNKGIGLTNTRRRLELLYLKKHNLEILSTDNFFEVVLKINLQ